MSGSKTQVMVLTLQKHWRGIQGREDRRRHRRFDATSVGGRLAVVLQGDAELAVEPCTLVNVSYGGMCFRAPLALEDGSEHRFLLDLKQPFDDMVMVRARVRWADPGESNERTFGAEFIESSKGWLGPDAE